MRTAVAASVLALAGSASAQVSSVAALVASLRNAPTQVDRISQLNDTQYTFDFLNPPSGVTTGDGGHTVAASSENFPAVIGNGVAMTIGFLGPCGMNTPHTHPRATEINFSLNTTLQAGFLQENGARFVTVSLEPGMAAVFPQGAIHFEMNPSCEPAMFVAGFNGEDPGVQQQAQRYLGLPPDIVGATLNGLGIEQVFGLESMLPDNVALGNAECLARCNITRPATPPTQQRQPRVPGNAYPSGIGSAAIPTPTFISASSSAPAAASSTPAVASSVPVVASSSAAAAPSSAPTVSSSAPAASSAPAPASAAPSGSASGSVPAIFSTVVPGGSSAASSAPAAASSVADLPAGRR